MTDIWLLVSSTVVLSAPLVLAALGGLCSERSGVINIALEGIMLTSACVTAIVGVATGSALFGAAAGVGSAIVVSLLHALLTQAYSIDHIVSGMAINAVAIGGTNFLAKSLPKLSSQKVPTFGVVWYWGLAFAAVVWLGTRGAGLGSSRSATTQRSLDRWGSTRFASATLHSLVRECWRGSPAR